MVRVFLDTSALFAGIWSAEGGARMVLKLGEAGAVQILVSAQVLGEIEGAIRRKAPDSLGTLALLLDRSGAQVVSPPTAVSLRSSQELVGYANDALVIAAAWEADVDYCVTLDQQHFLGNAALRQALPFPMGTPGDFLAWYHDMVHPDG